MKNYKHSQIKQFMTRSPPYIQKYVSNRYRKRHYNDNNNFYNIKVYSFDGSFINISCLKTIYLKELIDIIKYKTNNKYFDLFKINTENCINCSTTNCITNCINFKKINTILDSKSEQTLFILQKIDYDKYEIDYGKYESESSYICNCTSRCDTDCINYESYINDLINIQIKSEIAYNKERICRFNKPLQRLQQKYKEIQFMKMQDNNYDDYYDYYDNDYYDDYYDDEYY